MWCNRKPHIVARIFLLVQGNLMCSHRQVSAFSSECSKQKTEVSCVKCILKVNTFIQGGKLVSQYNASLILGLAENFPEPTNIATLVKERAKGENLWSHFGNYLLRYHLSVHYKTRVRREVLR